MYVFLILNYLCGQKLIEVYKEENIVPLWLLRVFLLGLVNIYEVPFNLSPFVGDVIRRTVKLFLLSNLFFNISCWN